MLRYNHFQFILMSCKEAFHYTLWAPVTLCFQNIDWQILIGCFFRLTVMMWHWNTSAFLVTNCLIFKAYIRWLKINASTLTVFEDIWNILWYEVNKDFISFRFLSYFLISDHWSANSDEKQCHRLVGYNIITFHCLTLL